MSSEPSAVSLADTVSELLYYCVDCATAELSGPTQTIESASRPGETADATMDRQ